MQVQGTPKFLGVENLKGLSWRSVVNFSVFTFIFYIYLFNCFRTKFEPIILSKIVFVYGQYSLERFLQNFLSIAFLE